GRSLLQPDAQRHGAAVVAAPADSVRETPTPGEISMRNRTRSRNAALVAAAVLAALPGLADISTNNGGPVQQGQTGGVNNSAETISLSGTTSFVSFIQSGAISLLSPGSSITLHNGSGGAPVTYYSPSNVATSVQLASNNFLAADT